MFVAILTYVSPLEEIDSLMSAHVAFLAKHYADGLFVASGRQIPRTGGVILVRSNERTYVQSVLSEDPFVIAGVATLELIEFKPSKMQRGFELFESPRNVK
jgi:uncharacterized protein YciI